MIELEKRVVDENKCVEINSEKIPNMPDAVK
jgi:hypothetical protein